MPRGTGRCPIFAGKSLARGPVATVSGTTFQRWLDADVAPPQLVFCATRDSECAGPILDLCHHRWDDRLTSEPFSSSSRNWRLYGRPYDRKTSP